MQDQYHEGLCRGAARVADNQQTLPSNRELRMRYPCRDVKSNPDDEAHAMPNSTTLALLTDLDGVIRDWSGQGDAAIEHACGLPEGAIKGAAFAPDLLLPAITGQVTDAAWRGSTIDRLRERYPDADAERAMAAWSMPTGEIDQRVLALVRQARDRVPVVLITNATDRLPLDLATLGILNAFDHIVNSSVTGAAKPDLAIYRHALETAGVAAGAALYVDDQQHYLDAAAGLGIDTHLFRGVEGLHAALERHGLLA